MQWVRQPNSPFGGRRVAGPCSSQWKPSWLVAHHTSARSQSRDGMVSVAFSGPTGGESVRRQVYHT